MTRETSGGIWMMVEVRGLHVRPSLDALPVVFCFAPGLAADTAGAVSVSLEGDVYVLDAGDLFVAARAMYEAVHPRPIGHPAPGPYG